LVAHVAVSGENVEMRSDRAWNDRTMDRAGTARKSEPGQPVLVVDPSPEMVVESLRALYLIGQKADAPAVDRYARGIEGMPSADPATSNAPAKEIAARAVTGDR